MNFIIFSVLLALCLGAQDLHITHKPNYLKFHPQAEELQSGDVQKVISHVLGVPTESELKWNGILQTSFFKRPKANVLITIVGHKNMGNDFSGVKTVGKYHLNSDMPMVDIPQLTDSVRNAFDGEKSPMMVDFFKDNDLFDIVSDSPLFGKLPKAMKKLTRRLMESDSVWNNHDCGSMNMSSIEDQSLMAELQMMKDVVNTVTDNKEAVVPNTPDLFSFKISSLPDIVKKHGSNSKHVKDATNLISDVINQLTNDFKHLYSDNVLMEVMYVQPPESKQIRKTRSLKAVPATKGPDINLADNYGEEYPAIFNIILWLMVFFFVLIYVVSYGIWNMDPGRDSIIYRMTSQRLKKD